MFHDLQQWSHKDKFGLGFCLPPFFFNPEEEISSIKAKLLRWDYCKYWIMIDPQKGY